MNQQERLLNIIDYLEEHHTMSIHAICKHLNVSRDLAREDILKLIEMGEAVRTYGGVSLPARCALKAYRERLNESSGEKERIAQEAITWINENGHYYFDASTNIRCLVQKLHQRVTVFTDSLDNIELLSEKENVEVHSLGGRLDKKNRYFYQVEFEKFFDRLHFDAAFLGVYTIREDGLYYPDAEDALIKEKVIARASSVILLTEYEKFDAAGAFTGAKWRGATWDQIDMIITDQQLSPEYVKILTLHEVKLIVV